METNNNQFEPSGEPEVVLADAAFWTAFGFQSEDTPSSPDTLRSIMPKGVVAFAAASASDNDTLISHVRRLSQPMLRFVVAGRRHYLYRLAEGWQVREAGLLPGGVIAIGEGHELSLPIDEAFDVAKCPARSIANLSILREANELVERIAPPRVDTPLSAFSLRGQAAAYEERAVTAERLVGEVCLSGQATVWYGAPNAGKTLICLSLLSEAVAEKRVSPDNVFYINADDGSEGFATKMRLMDDIGVHTLSPGHRGFRSNDLVEHFRDMAQNDSGKGVLVILDTLKKFTDIMDKRQTSGFAQAARQFVMAGGTLLALAHTNKNTSASGKLVYAGTADILQDFDSAFLLTPLEGENSDRVVEFEALKRRGGGTAKVAYAYTPEDGISYEERLASVRLVDADYLNSAHRAEAERADEPTIASIKACIELGVNKKMQLAKAAAKRAKVSERTAIRVLEDYTGDTPGKHHWTYRVQARGAKVYTLHGTEEGIAG